MTQKTALFLFTVAALLCQASLASGAFEADAYEALSVIKSTSWHATRRLRQDVALQDRLLEATADDKPDLIREIIEGGADPNFITSLSRTRVTPLIVAAFNGNVQATTILLELGADPTISMPETETHPLGWAVVKSFPEVAVALVEGGLDVDNKFGGGETQLQQAATSGNLAMVQILVELGANIEEKSVADGNTPLIYAALGGHAEILAFLVEKGAELDGENGFGGTALHFACVFGQNETVSLLIKAGAAVDPQDDAGNTPAHLAAFEGHKDVLVILLEAGADISIKSFDDELPEDVVCACLTEEDTPNLQSTDGFPSPCEARCTTNAVGIQELLKSV